jgi:hypothetical protein
MNRLVFPASREAHLDAQKGGAAMLLDKHVFPAHTDIFNYPIGFT